MGQMLHRRFVTTAGAFLLALALIGVRGGAAVFGDTATMPVQDIRPGMIGVGRTVFDGVRVEDFKVNIIGVLENVIGPNRNLILAKLEGGPLAHTGVIAGMSGSPVYVDGKLIGAVSYALGSFSKEPIAGITPIAEMTDSAQFADVRPASARVRVEYPLTRQGLAAAFEKALNWNRPFADRATDVRPRATTAADDRSLGQLGTMLRPIATPLVMSGFEPALADLLGGAFREQGFEPAGGSAAGFHFGEKPFEGPLKPGDAIGVMLVGGDLMLGGTGTVTHIDGDRVYAFGHPMYNLGPTEFPMTRAYVYTVLPSLFSSIKLSSTGEVIGTFLQDRATTIAGRLGSGPRMIPVTIALSSSRAATRTFKYTVVNDPLFGPLMTYASLLNTLMSYERSIEAATFAVRGSASVRQHDSVTFNNIFSGDQSSIAAATYIVGPVLALMNNDHEKVDLDGVELAITTTEQPKTAVLERIWLDDLRPRAGRTVPLKMLLRTYRGEPQMRTVPIEIPSNARGTLSIVVTDGGRLGMTELRETRTPQGSRAVDQLIKSLNKNRRNDTLYVRLVNADAGAVVSGETLSSLPPSVLNVLEGERSGGNFNPLHNATLGEWELATDHAVSGSKTLTLTVSQN
ncbi:MAG TPA: SpoIVB peptidase S55 domain-containing protein [Vicinamibacterales bacterium]